MCKVGRAGTRSGPAIFWQQNRPGGASPRFGSGVSTLFPAARNDPCGAREACEPMLCRYMLLRNGARRRRQTRDFVDEAHSRQPRRRYNLGRCAPMLPGGPGPPSQSATSPGLSGPLAQNRSFKLFVAAPSVLISVKHTLKSRLHLGSPGANSAVAMLGPGQGRLNKGRQGRYICIALSSADCWFRSCRGQPWSHNKESVVSFGLHSLDRVSVIPPVAHVPKTWRLGAAAPIASNPGHAWAIDMNVPQLRALQTTQGEV
jgi:hypothetical protein